MSDECDLCMLPGLCRYGCVSERMARLETERERENPVMMARYWRECSIDLDNIARELRKKLDEATEALTLVPRPDHRGEVDS